MGRMVLIGVLSLVFALSMIGYNLNRRATDSVKNYVGNFSVTRAHDIASSAAELFVLKLKEDPSLLGTFNVNPILGGSAVLSIVKITGPYDSTLGITLDSLEMTSVGTYDTYTDTVMNKLYPVHMTIPPIYGGLGMSAGRSASISVGGNASVNGIDKNTDGTPVQPPDSVAGIAINSTASSGTISVNQNVIGKGAIVPDTERVSSLPDYTSFANSMIRLATVYTGQTFSSGTLGTDASPQITYFTGNTAITGPVTGSGILIVNGSLSMSGSFNFHGLVIVYGSAKITVTQTGTSSVYGALLIAGDNTSYYQRGNSLVQYSTPTLKNVEGRTIGKYLIADWWE